MAKILYYSEEDVNLYKSPPVPTHGKFKNLLGKVIDKLTIMKYYGKKSGQGDHFWFCLCSCGMFTVKSTSSLQVKGRLQQCFKCTRNTSSKMDIPLIEERMQGVHNNKYIYDFSGYVNTKSKILMHCPDHGSFFQEVGAHLSGKECKTCGRLKANLNHRNDKRIFLERSKAMHGDRYNYDKVVYETRRTHVTITCKDHGDFTQHPANHWEGMGCPVCRYITSASKLRSTTEEFIVKAVKKHGNKYDYSNVNYEGSALPVKIVCPLHGEFEQTPSIHCQGFGCNSCSTRGYNTKKGGYFYISSLDGIAIKYGITGKEPKKRMVQHNRESVFNHEVLHSFFFSDGYIPKKIESYVKNNIGKKFVSKEELPDGYTETCCISKLDEILKVVATFTEENR